MKNHENHEIEKQIITNYNREYSGRRVEIKKVSHWSKLEIHDGAKILIYSTFVGQNKVYYKLIMKALRVTHINRSSTSKTGYSSFYFSHKNY